MRRIRLIVWIGRSMYVEYKMYRAGEGGGGGGEIILRDTRKGGNGGNIQSMVTSHYFIFRQIALLVVSDHCVKKSNVCPVAMNIYFLKPYGLDSI